MALRGAHPIAIAAIVRMCRRSQEATEIVAALMRRKGVKNEARTSALRGSPRMAVAAIEQMRGRSDEWHRS